APEARTLRRRERRAREAVVGAERALALGEEGAEAKLAEATAAHREAMAALWQGYPRLARVLTIAPATLGALRERLPEGTGVLSYFAGTKSTVVLIIDAVQVDAVELPVGRAQLSELVDTLRRQMDAFHPVERQLAQVSENILSPLREQISG